MRVLPVLPFLGRAVSREVDGGRIADRQQVVTGDIPQRGAAGQGNSDDERE
ncbi:MAG: hypothetical protein QGH42_12080 [Kiritimatiellia bacterium]|jgi:hypothetical protein|nr:hypothetical protein [Kiritimatiellia bacterium]MDP6631727.1 hypothetical protein [Kiritimatiellia bacterium]MDP6810520.1 hypothetical protein [Kiritimatiellia bacterium]MDP7024963.1 hypothetical protein [Kiritimatiellia bacterium]